LDTKSYLLALRDRVALGNEKLYKAWEQMKHLEGETYQTISDEYDKKRVLLEALCVELKANGYRDCLYIDENSKKTKHCLYNPDQPGWFCRVCPSEKPYWEREMMTLPDTRPKGSLL